MKSIVFKVIISILFICANPDSIIAQETIYLDGNSYAVGLTMLSGGGGSSNTWVNDTFIFESGEMYCVGLKRREGFKPSSYSPSNSGTDEDPVIKFAYESYNRYGSNLKIQGIVQD